MKQNGPEDQPARVREIQIVPVEASFSIEDEFLSEGDPGPVQDSAADRPHGSSAAIVASDESSQGDVTGDGEKEYGVAAALSLADLLENDVAVEWREAVAIAQRVCRVISRHPAAGVHEYLLDPRHVEITERGDVRVLPGPPGGDPVVKQVGRILRALLEGGSAPVQLRLIASQAAFELPGFASIEELSEALKSFEAAGDADTIRTAFKRGREAKFSAPVDHPVAPAARAALGVSIPIAPDLPPRSSVALPGRTPAPTHLVARLGLVGALVAGTVVAWLQWPATAGSPPVVPTTAVRTAADVVAPPQISPRREAAAVAAAAVVPSAGDVSAAKVSARPAGEAAGGVAKASRSPVQRRVAPSAPPAITSLAPRAKPPVAETVAALPAVNGLPRDRVEPIDVPDRPIDRARALLRARRSGDAQLILDSIVLSNPFFELDAGMATPALAAALQTSRRALLPAIALKDLANARAALAAGDYDGAIADGNRASSLLALDGSDRSTRLRAAVEQLLATAAIERTRAEQRIYSSADVDVTPPAALGRQLPASRPAGLPDDLVGTLEIVVSREGDVETVTLHTPLNRFHERMIVSAAKAWRYRPALRNGRPVRFRLINAINLPEN